MKKLLTILLLFPSMAFAAGSSLSCTTSDLVWKGDPGSVRMGKLYTCPFTADDTVANTQVQTSIEAYGYLVKVATGVGGTAPSANWDVELFDAQLSDLDALEALGIDRPASSAQFYPNSSGATVPLFLNGTYTLSADDFGVVSSTGTIYLTVVNPD